LVPRNEVFSCSDGFETHRYDGNFVKISWTTLLAIFQ